jgi:hypothetical protein
MQRAPDLGVDAIVDALPSRMAFGGTAFSSPRVDIEQAKSTCNVERRLNSVGPGSVRGDAENHLAREARLNELGGKNEIVMDRHRQEEVMVRVQDVQKMSQAAVVASAEMERAQGSGKCAEARLRNRAQRERGIVQGINTSLEEGGHNCTHNNCMHVLSQRASVCVAILSSQISTRPKIARSVPATQRKKSAP